jgi:hypothetical protein
MERRNVALLVIATGVVMVLIALLADVLGIGAEGFGWRRGALLAVGIVVVLAGVARHMTPAREDGTAPTPPDADDHR